jgi:formylglycine-generating enzyme required for sulfatase activity
MDDTPTTDAKDGYGTPSGVRRALAASLKGQDARRQPAVAPPGDLSWPVERPREPAFTTAALPPPPSPAPPAAPSPERPADGRFGKLRHISLWGWWVGGAVLFLLVSLLLSWLLAKEPGFVLTVRGMPPGSDVYVDNKLLGVMRADATISVAALESGKRVVRVSHRGYDDFNASVIGKDGETKSVIYSAQARADETPSAAAEIDYSGAMVLIKAGEFVMGDDGHEANEKPAHKVILNDYYMDKFEVTNAQYKKFCDETRRPYPTNPHWDGGYFENNPDEPVVGVNWNDAAAYARWAGKRLPTEEEWEKAASWDAGAQQKRQWPWGNSPEPGRINLGADHPDTVGRQPGGASAYGVQDMAGSVAEWVDAFYQPYPGNPSADPNYGAKNRVVRGGHFRLEINDVRTTARFYHGPEFESAEKKLRSWLTGFRCAVSADDPRLREFLRAHTAGK